MHHTRNLDQRRHEAREAGRRDWTRDIVSVRDLGHWMIEVGLIVELTEMMNLLDSPHRYQDKWEQFQASAPEAA